ncbi:MAG: YggS family pyridoxal phosphate-dependent enzyme [Candidatus Rokubacteria bacterium]|nr:YggS family pyridoxal phosphate-dependent enzyme [Candidatus Rokubacteria bacterium]MBI3106406.1 YggS family pyridoxal phosphate-dependent enzyme [Candidatus Rokubacteria bacterium]
MVDIRRNVEGVQAAIERACRRCGRDPREVLLIAVSKTVDLARIRLAVEAGVPALGENRVQEAKEKVATLGHPVPWHLIGSLQTNKAKEAARIFDCIQAVDRLELAHELDRRAQAAGRVVDGLLQVNLGEEPQKGGLPPAEVKAVLDQVAALQGLRIRGLMAIPPLVPAAEAARPYFRRLRELRDAVGLEHLSMGMSGDFEVAIDEGATMVRVGTAIFGPRAARPGP